MIGVRNLGNQTYRSAIVVLTDSARNELNRSDGNNEFLPNSNTCPGGEQELRPGQEKYVAIALRNTPPGDTLTVRVTVCTETGYKGECFTSATRFME
jgi:hypothetical protein